MAVPAHDESPAFERVLEPRRVFGALSVGNECDIAASGSPGSFVDG
jgi:hypothetical protein